MERDRINQIEVFKYKKKKDVIKGEEEQCPICITEFENDEDVRRLPCKHLFHPTCVDTWLVQNSHCPCCKLDLNNADIRE